MLVHDRFWERLKLGFSFPKSTFIWLNSISESVGFNSRVWYRSINKRVGIFMQNVETPHGDSLSFLVGWCHWVRHYFVGICWKTVSCIMYIYYVAFMDKSPWVHDSNKFWQRYSALKRMFYFHMEFQKILHWFRTITTNSYQFTQKSETFLLQQDAAIATEVSDQNTLEKSWLLKLSRCWAHLNDVGSHDSTPSAVQGIGRDVPRSQQDPPLGNPYIRPIILGIYGW